MVLKLGSMWNRLVGARNREERDPPAESAVDYQGWRIRPTPYPANGQYQTAGIIERDTPEGVKEHRFVRAETHPTKDGAAAFAITKGKQIIDEVGERIFDSV
jgi:hypothetical protein